MTPLPTQSTGSLLHGLWYVFPVGDDILRVWTSALSGKDRIYVNDTLVHEGRSFRMRTVRHVAMRGVHYDVIVEMKSVTKAQYTCRLQRDDDVLGEYLATYIGPFGALRPRGFAKIIVAGVCAAVLRRLLEPLPMWVTAVLAAGVVVAAIARTHITIEKVEPRVRGELTASNPLSFGRADERAASPRTPRHEPV